MSVNTNSDDGTTYISGQHSQHGKYQFKLYHNVLSNNKTVETTYEGRYIKSVSNLWKLKDDWIRPSLNSNFMKQQEKLNKKNRSKNKQKKRKKRMKKYPNVIPKLSNHIFSFGGSKVKKTNVLAVQKVLTTPFILNIQTKYKNHNDEKNDSENDVQSRILAKFETYSNQFSETFQQIFNCCSTISISYC